MTTMALISAHASVLITAAQQTWNTPAWAVVMFVAAVLVQGVWLLVKTIVAAMNAKANDAKEFQERARRAEDSLILSEIRAVAKDVARIDKRLAEGERKFDEFEQRFETIEKDVHELRMRREGSGA